MKSTSTDSNSIRVSFSLATLTIAALLAGLVPAQASPDPAVSISNGVALFQGNQANGISASDFHGAPVHVLNVNSLSGAIQPAAGTLGIDLRNSGAGNVSINAGSSESDILVNTRNAAGIYAESVGAPQYNPIDDPFLGIPIPTNSAVPGGVVRVQNYGEITTEGNNSSAIVASSRTTGFSPAVIQQLESYTAAGITFTVTGVTNANGTPATLGGPVAGGLVDENGLPVAGDGGTFTLNNTGGFSFDPGTNFNGLAVGEAVQSVVSYSLHGDNGKGVTHETSGSLVAVITMTTNGLVFSAGAYFDEYGPSTNLTSALPDLISYSRSLAATAAAGGDGNSVLVDQQGTNTTHGVNSYGVLAQSAGGNGGRGRDGSISHSAGGGGNGSNGGTAAVNVDGGIVTTNTGSCGVVAWSQGGTGGNGGDGGTWRYGARGGTGGNGGEVDVNGSGSIHTVGDYASGILAVSAGGNGGNGGSGGGVTGGGGGGFGGRGGEVLVDGNWSITTEGDFAHGIWAKSVGGNAGGGGSGGWLAGAPGSGGAATDGGTVSVVNGGRIYTFGSDSYGIYAESIGGFGGQGGSQNGIFYSHGGDGNSAGSGGNVQVTQEASGEIVTWGTNAHGIFAQSVGGGGGSGGGAGAIAGIGGTSGAGGFGGTAHVTNYGSITTFGESARGIYAQSIGGGGGDGGSGAGIAGIGGSGAGTSPGGLVTVANFGSITTTGKLSDGIFAQSIGGGGGSAGRAAGLVAIGGSGNGGGNGSNVTVLNAGWIQTSGYNARGVFAQSVGGGGGDGGSSGGLVSIGGDGSRTSDGGEVHLLNSGTIHSSAQALFAQSIGGGGGNGGSSGGWFSFGGTGGKGGGGGRVTVDNTGDLLTTETNASAIFAQSVGGGGGNGGNSLAVGTTISVAVGGQGGDGGAGSDVAVNSTGGSIITEGAQAHGVFAQSVGGGGGNGGYAFAATVGKDIAVSIAIGGSAGGGGNAGDVAVINASSITNFGNNSHGIFAQSVGGGGGSGGFSVAASASGGVSGSFSLGGKGGGGGQAGSVTLQNSGTIQTFGNHSYGLLAQSVGGGGGDGGFAVAGSFSPSAAASLGIGGSGNNGGLSEDVAVLNSGCIYTTGDDSHALFAQSVGGGGGSGGFSVAGNISGGVALGVGIGGSGGGGASAGDVRVTNSAALLTTSGNRAYGVLAQSVGGGGGDGGFNVSGNISKAPSVGFGLGGSGASAGNGGAVSLDSSSSVLTLGSNSHALFAQSVGGGGGSGGFSIVGSISAQSAAIGLSLGGSGSGGGSADAVSLTSQGDHIVTFGDRSDGILAQSVGGGGGDGGFSIAGSISKGPALDISIGGKGGAGGSGSSVVVQNDSFIFTGGQLSYGILAQSVGGGGGSGGFSVAGELSAQSSGLAFSMGGKGGSGGSGGQVSLANSGGVTTTNKGSHGIFAQSVGGGGGAGGLAGSLSGGFGDGASLSVALGGKGGSGANAGAVAVTNLGRLETLADSASGIYAQSVGGGGGDGGFGIAAAFGTSQKAVDLAVAIGGSGNTGGVASVVMVDNRNAITTSGSNSIGIFAQSIGGGGGNGGFSAAGTLSTSTNSKQLSVSVGGSGGRGNNAGRVYVLNSGSITTSNDASSGIQAQSVGGGGGNGGFSFAGTFSGAGSKNVSVAVGGSGGAGGMGSNVFVNNSGGIETFGVKSRGIYAQSVGGGGGDGGASIALNLSTGATNSSSLNIGVSVGGGGGAGQRAGDVQVTGSGQLITHGDSAAGVQAQSIGGGGGNGGFSLAGSAVLGAKGGNTALEVAVGGGGGDGNSGGAVSLDYTGTIETWGDGSHGIWAESIGGGGGEAGGARSLALFYGKDTNSNNKTFNLSIGGTGGGASDGGTVMVTNHGNITTHGGDAHAIYAQSTGGGGGAGGDANFGSPVPGGTASTFKSLQITVGGNAGSSGNGAAVTVKQTGHLVTVGDGSVGIYAQSVGGGGGEGGAGQLGLTGKISIGGAGGAAGDGGKVSVHSDGDIDTWGAAAHGIFAQSIGGGGGVAGNINRGLSSILNVGIGLGFGRDGGSAGDGGSVESISSGNITTRGTGAIGLLAQSVGGGGGLAGQLGNDLPGLSLLNFAGSVGGVGSGGTVTVAHSGDITTLGENAHGIFAQSAGGTNGVGGNVAVTLNGRLSVQGANADGIFAQSRGESGAGNISIRVNSGSVTGGAGTSAGLRLADGADNTINNFGTITTLNGVTGTSIAGGAGNEAVENYGLLTGGIDLGAGTNSFYNHGNGRLESGDVIALGRGSRFLNSGTLAPGGRGSLGTTVLSGNYVQTGSGVFQVKLGAPGVSDSLLVSGTASLSGTLSVSRLDGFLPEKGERFMLVTANEGITGKFDKVEDPLTGHYALRLDAQYQATQASLLTLQDSFAPFARTPNQFNVASNLDTLSGFLGDGLHGDARETNLVTLLNKVAGPELPTVLDLLAPEEMGAMFDLQFGAVDAIGGTIAHRMSSLRGANSLSSGTAAMFQPGAKPLILASADSSLPAMAPSQPARDWELFGSGYGQFVTIRGTGDAAGYSLNSSGAILGMDKQVNNRFAGGVSLAYANGDANLVNAGGVQMQGGRAGLHASWFGPSAYLEGQLGGGGGHYDTRRVTVGGIADGSTDSYEVDTMLGSGYNVKAGHFTAGVLGEIHYAHVGMDSLKESGSLAPLKILNDSSDSLRTLVGTRLAYDWSVGKTVLQPEVRLGWRHEFLDTTRTVESQMASGAGGVFQVQGPSMGRDSLSFAIGFNARVSQRLSVFAYYDSQLALQNTSSQTINGGLSFEF